MRILPKATIVFVLTFTGLSLIAATTTGSPRMVSSSLNKESFSSLTTSATVAYLDVGQEVVRSTQPILFNTIEQKDDRLFVGEKKIKQKGVNGLLLVKPDIIKSYTPGNTTQRQTVLQAPANEIILIGTKQKLAVDHKKTSSKVSSSTVSSKSVRTVYVSLTASRSNLQQQIDRCRGAVKLNSGRGYTLVAQHDHCGGTSNLGSHRVGDIVEVRGGGSIDGKYRVVRIKQLPKGSRLSDADGMGSVVLQTCYSSGLKLTGLVRI